LIELESATEETAVVEDSQQPRFMLTTNFVDRFKVEQEMANGMTLNAQSQCMEERLDS
jgi:hypothetical protein